MKAPIVAGIDGSAHTWRALAWAAEEARLHASPLRLVFASSTLAHDGWLTPEGHERLRKDRTRLLNEARQRALGVAPGIEVETELMPEEAGRALVGESDRAAMIVVGARGTGGFEGLLIGSVGLHVAAYARCPVLLVPADAEDPDVAYGDIVIGLDERRPADRALGRAFDEAELRKARLTVLHAIGGEYGAPGQRIGEEMEMSEALAGWTPDHPDVTVLRVVAERTAARALVEASEKADMVIVGARRREHRHLGMALGRVNHAVLLHARCPVLVVPES